MSTSPRILLKLAGLGIGAFVGGPLAACIGEYLGTFGYDMVAKFLTDKDIATHIAGIGDNLFASKLEEYIVTPCGKNGFRDDLRKALAEAMADCLSWDSQRPGPVQKRLLEKYKNTNPFGDYHSALQSIFNAWRKLFADALAVWPEQQQLEALFPSTRPESNSFDLVQKEENGVSVNVSKRLLESFYEHTLAPSLKDMNQASALPGGEANLRNEFLDALSKELPARFSEIIKRDEFKNPWIEFQKVIISATRGEVQKLGSQFKEFDEQLALLSRRTELLGSTMADALAKIENLLSQTQENAKDIQRFLDAQRQLLNDQHEPSLYVPVKIDKDCGIFSKLRFDAQWVECVGRDAEKKRLCDFLNDNKPFSWWGLIGDGGIGKSRLALELIIELDKSGWYAGFLQPETEWLDLAHGHVHSWHPSCNTLIVVDYAACYGATLVSALAQLGDQSSHFRHKVRILLLDRPGAVSPLFSEVAQRTGPPGYVQTFNRAINALYRPEGVECPPASANNLLREEQLCRLDRLKREEWRVIVANVLELLGDKRTLPSSADKAFWNKVARITDNGRPLLLQVAAQFLTRPEVGASEPLEFNSDSTNQLIDALLDHEKNERWPLMLPESIRKDERKKTEYINRLERGIALITLTRGLNLPASGADLQSFTNEPQTTFDSFTKHLKGVLHTESRSNNTCRIRPLIPDLFGERLLVQQCQVHPETGIKNHKPTDYLSMAFKIDPQGTASTLSLMARDFSDDAQDWLCAAFDYIPATACTSLVIEKDREESFLTLLAHTAATLSNTDSLAISSLGKAVQSCAEKSIGNRYRITLGLLAATSLNSQNDPTTITVKNDVYRFILERLLNGCTEDLAYYLLLAKGAVNAIYHYGSQGRFDDLERWAGTLANTASQFSKDQPIQFCLALGAVNAIKYYGDQGRFDDLKQWAGKLANTASQFPMDQSIQFCLAQGAVNAIKYYGDQGRFDDLEQWADTLANTASQFPKDQPIQYCLAQGAVNTINHYASQGRFDDLERWADKLANTASQFPMDQPIQLELANGAINAIHHFGNQERFDDLERWAGKLVNTASQFPMDQPIQLCLAQGAVNAINYYGNQGRFDDLEQWAGMLANTVSQFPKDQPIQLCLAKGAVNAIADYGKQGHFDDLERWADKLTNTVSQFPKDQPIQYCLAQGAVNAIHRYASQGRFDDLKQWADKLANTASQFPMDQPIQLCLAQGVVNAINHYPSQGSFDDLERWVDKLAHTASQFPMDQPIQLCLAKGAVNAIANYGKQGRFDDLKHWTPVLQNALVAAAMGEPSSELAEDIVKICVITILLERALPIRVLEELDQSEAIAHYIAIARKLVDESVPSS